PARPGERPRPPRPHPRVLRRPGARMKACMKVSRRRFLRLGLAGAGGLALAGLTAACGHKETPLTAPSLGGLLSARRAAGGGNGLDVFLGGEDYVASTESYVAFFLQRRRG